MCFEAPKRAGNYFVLCSWGVGGEEPLFPKAPKPFSEKASPRISATTFTASAETCQQYFKRFTKVMRRIVRAAWYGALGRARHSCARRRLNCKQHCVQSDCLPYRTR